MADNAQFQFGAAAGNESILGQADTLWKMLDDLAETNPEGYRKLIDNVIKEQKEHWKPPEAVFCFRTVKLPETSNHHVFINICKWERVSKPKEGDTKISVVASNLRDLPEVNSKHSVMDICFHNDIIDQTKKDIQGWRYVASLALDYIEKQAGIKLSTAYKILTIKYKGNIDELKRYLFTSYFGKAPSVTTKPDNSTSGETESGSILEGLSKIVMNGEDPKAGGIARKIHGSPGEKRDGNKPKRLLIQEMSTSRKEKVTKEENFPKHHIEMVEATNEKPKCIMIKVELPQINSGAECALDVSKYDLELYSDKFPKLHLQLPQEGNEDKTTSTFNKSTHELTIIIPLAET
ncbi:PIH1 domain-containing protein 2-like [Dendronephthya gigantea]|uniref:PIH1 domain-containing protein 2-like n=1 Tax=Dendronephthya gigantea TaxID=151771 RepID=UPI00106B1DAF|nr:PIH1 domain-containing protein 2-like [Dendronephthya gigantea]